jgi:hypothetical protein
MRYFILLCALCFALGFPSVLLYLFRVRQLQRLLAVHEPKLYEQLGKPDVIFNNTLGNSKPFIEALKSHHFEHLNNPEVSARARSLRKLYLFLRVVIIIMFLSFALGMYGSRES